VTATFPVRLVQEDEHKSTISRGRNCTYYHPDTFPSFFLWIPAMENGDDQVVVHRPADFIGPKFYTRVLPRLVILNTPIPDSDQNLQAFRRIWENAKPRICADGGANRLYDLFQPPGNSNAEAQRKYLGSRDSYVSRTSFCIICARKWKE
jgi:hypothetical protein